MLSQRNRLQRSIKYFASISHFLLLDHELAVHDPDPRHFVQKNKTPFEYPINTFYLALFKNQMNTLDSP